MPFLLTWISYYMHRKGWGEITYPFPNFNAATVEVWHLFYIYIRYISEKNIMVELNLFDMLSRWGELDVISETYMKHIC